jgi:hypothetical protein
MVLARLSVFRNEHFRFFQELKSFWDELACLNDELNITQIRLRVDENQPTNFSGAPFETLM